MSALSAVRLDLGGGAAFLLESELETHKGSQFVPFPRLGLHWSAVLAAGNSRVPIAVMESESVTRRPRIRLFENADYSWTLECPEDSSRGGHLVRSSLEAASTWRGRGSSGRFRVENFLGIAWIDISIGGRAKVRIELEVASRKLDYDTEYSTMLDAIAGQCHQLLLAWRSPTSVSLESDDRRIGVTRLEQVLMLRHALELDRLENAVDHIERHPHTDLRTELQWQPSARADARSVARQPLTRGRDWRRGGTSFSPSEVASERRFETIDTVPNRFVKRVLAECYAICEDSRKAMLESTLKGMDLRAAIAEIDMLQERFEVLMDRAFFREIADAFRIPYESSIVRGRPGYREVFGIWLQLQNATRLNWNGIDEVFAGGSRDAATLYEYWVYLTLVGVLNEDARFENCRNVEADQGMLPFFVERDTGRVVINLRKGRTSVARFRYFGSAAQVGVHVYYNRKFSRSRLGSAGTYSTPLIPDVSFVLLPSEYLEMPTGAAEARAEAEGRIAYLHFDAKYRVERLSAVWHGSDLPNEGDEEPLVAKSEDLYKMHAYNDAIRRTVGSYVLYPGTVSDERYSTVRHERYHELVPGIGAFSVRPTSPQGGDSGMLEVTDFACRVIEHHADRFTQHSLVSTSSDAIMRESPQVVLSSDGLEHLAATPSAPVLLVPISPREEPLFRRGVDSSGPFCVVALDPTNVTALGLGIHLELGTIVAGFAYDGAGRSSSTSWIGRLSSAVVLKREDVAKQFAHAVASELALVVKMDVVRQFEPRLLDGLIGESKTASGAVGVKLSDLLKQPMYQVSVGVAET